MAKIFVKLGKKASSFRDASLNLSIRPGEVVELNLYQQNAPRVKRALNGGHLIRVADPKQVVENPNPVKSPEELYEEFQGMIETGAENKTIKSYFTLDQLKQIAAVAEVEIESNDTKATIIEALKETFIEEEEE